MLLTGAWHIGMPDSLTFESNAFFVFFFFATYLSDGFCSTSLQCLGSFSLLFHRWSKAGVPPDSLFIPSLSSQHSFIKVHIHIHRKSYLRNYCKTVIWKSDVKEQLWKNTRIHPCIPSIIQMEDLQIPNIKTVVQIRRPVKLVNLEQPQIFKGDRYNVGKRFTEESGD